MISVTEERRCGMADRSELDYAKLLGRSQIVTTR